MINLETSGWYIWQYSLGNIPENTINFYFAFRWSTRSRISVRKDISRICAVTPGDLNTVLSFKDKISMYVHERKNKDVGIIKEIPGKLLQCIEPTNNVTKSKRKFDSDLSDENEFSASSSIGKKQLNSTMLANVTSDTASCTSTGQIANELEHDANSSITIISENNCDGGVEKHVHKKMSKGENIKEVEEGFSDNEDFSTTKVKKKRKKPILHYKSGKSKRKKCDISTSPAHHKKSWNKSSADVDTFESLETINDRSITSSSQNTNNDKMLNDDNNVTIEKISMEDLIRTKDDHPSSQPLEEIHTLVAEKTIDVDDYGNVSLENVE